MSPSSCLADASSGNAVYYVSTTITGSGFAANSIITLSGPIEEHYTSGATDSTGSFSAPLVLFPRSGAGPGKYTITATDSKGNSASTVFEVISNTMCQFVFVGMGLSDDKTWSVTFDGETQTGTFSGGVSGLVFYRQAGTYQFTIPDADGVTPLISSGTLSGSGATQYVSFNGLYVLPESDLGTVSLLSVCLGGFLVWLTIMRRKSNP